MNILFLPKYGPLAASARQRYLQYIPALEQAGLRCTVSPLLGDDYLARRMQGHRGPVRAALRAYLRRAQVLREARGFDLCVLGYEAFPYLPGPCERALRIPYVVDYDDAVFHHYDQHRSALVRGLLDRKIAGVMARSAGVLCGSEYLARYARAHHPRVEVLPTVVDLDLYPCAPPPAPARPFTIGWIGSPSTAGYLAELVPVLQVLSREAPLRLLLVGAGPLRVEGVPLERRPWRQDREVLDLAEMDVGVMPLPDSPWARGKCGFKLIQYLASWKAVVASPVGANRDIVTHGETGLLCSSRDQWLAALRRLRDDRALRERLGRAGRAVVEARYCLRATAPRLLRFLLAAAGLTRARPGATWSAGASP